RQNDVSAKRGKEDFNVDESDKGFGQGGTRPATMWSFVAGAPGSAYCLSSIPTILSFGVVLEQRQHTAPGSPKGLDNRQLNT
ncbi:MAG: hypothetical protein ACRD68_05625, partial [Pyrinomonadaceae bacterium]